MIIGPACPSAISVGIRRWEAAQPGRGTQYAGVGPILIFTKSKFPCLVIKVRILILWNMATIFTRLEIVQRRYIEEALIVGKRRFKSRASAR